jgi:hypothetical protein
MTAITPRSAVISDCLMGFDYKPVPRAEAVGHAYALGACYAEPGGDHWHLLGCDVCDMVRADLDDVEFRAEFERGKRDQESWLRMHRHRRTYHRRRRYW